MALEKQLVNFIGNGFNFNITPEEQKVIEDTMEKYAAK